MAEDDNDWYPATGFYFSVEVGGDAVSFKEASGLTVNVGEDAKLKEGGVNTHEWKLPSFPTYSNLTLKRGVMRKNEAFNTWVEKCLFTDYDKPIELKTIILKLLKPDASPLIIWTFNDARPVKYEVSDFDSMKNEVLIETVELLFTFCTKEYAS